MNYNNLIALTAAAILSGADAAVLNVWTKANANDAVIAPAPPAAVHTLACTNVATVDDAIRCFKATNLFPENSPLSNKLAIFEKSDLFQGISPQALFGFVEEMKVHNILDQVCANLKSKALVDISKVYKNVRNLKKSRVFRCRDTETCGNKAAYEIFHRSSPDQWSADIDADFLFHTSFMMHNPMPLAKVNKIPKSYLQKYAYVAMEYLKDRKQVHLVDRSVLKTILENNNVHGGKRKYSPIGAITEKHFARILKNPDLASLFTGPVFQKLDDDVKMNVAGKHYSKYVRNLPKNVFANLESDIHPDFLRYATKSQLANFQLKVVEKAGVKCQLNPHLVHPHYTGAIHYKVWRKYFERYSNSKAKNGGAGTAWSQAQGAAMKNWSFWKRIPKKVFDELVKDTKITDIVPIEAFENLSKEQRQLILNAGDKEGANTNCQDLPIEIFKGKESRSEGLTVSKKCFKSKLSMGGNNDKRAEWIVEALGLGAVKPEFMKKLTQDHVIPMKLELDRPRKADKDGKMKKREPLNLDGVLTFEGLQKHANGAEYVKAFLNQDSDAPAEACKVIDHDQLRKCVWLQPLLNKKCVRAMDFNLDELAKLDPNITANLSKDQFYKLGSRSDLKSLEENVAAGLGKNKAFAKHVAFDKQTKEKDGKDVDKKMPIQLIKAEQLKKHFGAEFVANVPSENMADLAKVITGLSDSALAKADSAWVASHADVIKAASDEQYGHISDDVEINGFPASLSVGAVMAMPVSRVKALSAKFVGKMTPTGISAFSAEQVTAIPAESLCLVCGDKAAAFKHELSPAQKESLGKDCPAAKDSMAPSQFGAIAALAAAAAGSIALLL